MIHVLMMMTVAECFVALPVTCFSLFKDIFTKSFTRLTDSKVCVELFQARPETLAHFDV